MVSANESIHRMNHEQLMRIKELYESTSFRWNFFSGNDALNLFKTEKKTRSYKGFVDKLVPFEVGDMIHVHNNTDYLFLSKYTDPNRDRVSAGIVVSCFSNTNKVSSKVLFWGMLDAQGRETSYINKEFLHGKTFYAKTERIHDVFDLASSCSTYYELWDKIRGKSMKVVDIIKYKVASLPLINDNFTIHELKMPVFTFCNENVEEKILKQIELNEKKEKWGRSCKAFRTIRNEQNKWGIEDKTTEELIVDYVFDEIIWLEDIDCVKFVIEGKEALWRINKLRDLR